MTTASEDTARHRTAPGGTGSWLGQGLLAGFLAGAAFIALNSWFATTMGKPALGPFKTVATLAQGPPPPQATVWIGMVIHSVLAALLGVVFAALVAGLRGRSRGLLLWAGPIYGAVVYVVDFQVLSRFVPQFGAFLNTTNQPFELAAHLVFGSVLAALLVVGFGPVRRGGRSDTRG